MSRQRTWSSLAFVGCLAVASCTNGDDALTTESISVLRADGAEAEPPESEIYVWCGDFSEGLVEIKAPAVHVYSWPSLDPDYEGLPGGWIIRVVLEDIQPGVPLELPTSGFDLGIDDSRPDGADLFASIDFEDFSSQSAASTGSIVFTTVPCTEDNSTVDFEIDAVLGSEAGEEKTIHLDGAFSGGINEPPRRDIYQFD